MSELYSVSVARVEGDEVDFEVDVVHPDAGPVPASFCFALRLLWDPIDVYNHGRDKRVAESPLAQEMDLQDYLNEDFIEGNARGFVARVEVDDGENHPPPSWGEEGYETFWESGQVSTATLKVRAHHAGWLAHLSEGMSWETAAYGGRDARAWTRASRFPGDKLREPSDDPMEGMRRQSRSEVYASMASSIDVEAFTLPCLGPKHYTALEPIAGSALTLERARALLGEPVLVQMEGGRLEARALVKVSDDLVLGFYYESGSSSGGSSCRPNQVTWLGRAWYLRETWADEVEI